MSGTVVSTSVDSLMADRWMGESPQRWQDCWSHAEWRDIFLGLLEQGARGSAAVGTDLLREVSAQFSDGINTGFYINSYTTKHCPTMEGVLEEWRVGIQRLEELRQQERCKLERSTPVNEVQALAQKGKSPFAETMRTLNRLSSSYRRCYWKSGSESIFPILFGHMTFASHRTWTVYVKKAMLLAMEAWRELYGAAVRRAALADGGGHVLKIMYTDAAGMKSIWPLLGWRRREEDGETFLVGPNGEIADTENDAYNIDVATRRLRSGADDASAVAAYKFMQDFLNRMADEEADEQEKQGTRIKVATSTLEDWLWRAMIP